MTCRECQENLVLYGYGELPMEREEVVEQHVASCAECRAEELRLVAMSRVLAAERWEPSLTTLSECRQELADALRRVESRPVSWWSGWIRPLPGWAGSGFRLAASCALLVVGFGAGRLMPGGFPGLAARGEAVVASVGRAEAGDGAVRIVMRDSVAREVSGRLADPAVRALLVRAARESADAGVRMDSLDLLGDRIDEPEVLATLVAALRRDPDDGVRIRALELLRPVASRMEVRAEVLEALRKDQSALVRAQAVDLLTVGDGRSSEFVGALQELLQREQNPDVRRQGQSVLRAMNASVETF